MKRLFLILLFALSYTFSFAQEKVYLPYFEVINFHQDYQYSLTRLFKHYMDDFNPKYKVILGHKMDTIYAEPDEQKAGVEATKAGANLLVIGSLNRVGNYVIVSLKLINTQTSDVVWKDIMKAENPDDLDPILQRFATNMGSQNKASENGDIYSLTEYQSRELRKERATLSVGGSIEGMYMPVSNVKDGLSSGFGLNLFYDARKTLVLVNTDFLFGELNFTDININVAYPFAFGSNTLYAGGGLCWSRTSVNLERVDPQSYKFSSQSGLSLMFSGGYILNRQSTIMVRLNASLLVNMYEVSTTGIPIGGMFGISIIPNFGAH